MNMWQIIGGVVSILGTALMFYGSYLQGRSAQEFQGTVGNFVKKQEAEDIPNLVALTVKAKGSDFILTVKNVGLKPATKVKVIFSEKSMPSVFASNQISVAGEIPNNTEYTFPLNLFTGFDLMMKVPNSPPGYKESLVTSLEKFKTGEMAFIPRFYLEYYYDDRKFTSPTYFLVLEKNGRFLSFGKE